jgi:hypothetical protein
LKAIADCPNFVGVNKIMACGAAFFHASSVTPTLLSNFFPPLGNSHFISTQLSFQCHCQQFFVDLLLSEIMDCHAKLNHFYVHIATRQMSLACIIFSYTL